MMKQVFITADKLAEEIRNIQKCLQCTICLHTISEPVKTLCGHRFCHQCIQTLLQSKNALCPLCNRAIQRRSISKDEHMILYIDGLQKLIEAVQSDSGIDILSHLSRPRCSQQSESTGYTEFTGCNTKELIKPSCSYAGTSLQKEVVSKNQRGRRGKSLTSEKSRTKSTQKKNGAITKYLSKCGLSGIGQLDESNDSLDENLTQSKVTSWLENLSKQEALDSPYKTEIIQSPTCNFNDTALISVSQNGPQVKIDNFDKDVDTRMKDDASQSVRQVRRASLRSENNKSDSNNTSDRRTSTETRTAIASSKLDFDTKNPRPSTSRMTRSLDDSKERSEEKFIDVNRTSPCDMLSSMQKNWSSVEKFGKEMRTRKKKLKSLNVSIENKGKSRSVDEATANLNKEENVKRKVVDDIGNGRTRKRKDSMMAEDVVNIVVDERFDEGKKSSAKSDFVRATDASSPRNRKDRSMSEKVQSTTDFITLEEGRQVHIRYLNTCQMNAIIGVPYEDSQAGIETDQTNNGEETKLPTKRHVDLLDTPFYDRDKIFSQTTLTKSGSDQGETNLLDESRNKKNCSPTPMEKITMNDEADPTSNFQSSTPHRKRLSLKRSTDFKLNNSPNPIVDSRIGLQAVKRDLRFEIERESDQADGNVGADKRSLEEAVGTQKRRASTDDKLDGKRVRGLTATSTEFTNRRLENSGCNVPLVTFRKLGKTFKRRRKRIPFLYLGTTKRKAMVGHYPGFHLQRPCNPVDILGMQDYTIQDGFGNNALITLNDTQIIDEDEGKEAEPVATVTNVTEAVVFNNQIDHREENLPQEIQEKLVSVVEIPDNVENKSSDIDVLLVSLSGNRKPYHLPCDEQFVKSNNTSTKDTVKMIPSANDSQLQFLSLESPPIDISQTQKLIHETEPGTETNKVSTSGGFLHMSDQSDSPRTPMRKRKRFGSQNKFSDRMKRKSKVSDEEDVCSNHSFSSEITCIRNDDKEDPFFKTGLGKNCQSSDPSSKDTEIVSVNSGSNIAAREKGNKKVFKRILPIAGSSTDSPDIVSQDVSPTTKRKRVVSPDVSDGEWNAIVHNWVDERCKKKGKLEQTRDSSNLMNASRAVRDNASSKSGSSDRDKSTNKLSTLQCRQQLDFAGRSSDEETNFSGSKSRKSLEPKDSSIAVEDSPDFGLTIDRIKNIRNKTTELIQADTYDDIIANTDYEEIIIEDDNGKNRKSRRESVECLEIDSYERKSKSARSCVESSYSSSKDVPFVRSNGSDKENSNQISSTLCDSDNENEERLVPVHVNVVNKSLRKNRLQENSLKSSGNKSICISNKSLGQRSMTSSSEKHPANASMNNSTVKDMSEHDSLMDITQHDLLIKQFEMDLFEKNYTNSNVPLEMEKKILQTPKRNKKCSNADRKDVEHSGEEDDIVENTPNTKTKNLEAINSMQRSVVSSFSVSKTLEKSLPAKILQSTTGRCLTNISTPNSTINIPPLYQSTPKMHQPCNNATKLVPRANESSNKQTKNSIQRNMNRSVQENTVQRTNNIEEDVVQIINNSQDNIVKSTNNVRDIEKNIAQRAHYANKQRFCFVCSGLTIHEIDLVKKLTQMLDGRYLAQFDKDVTHVIVKADKNNRASNTLKYLQGIVHRKWIVSYQWVVDSVKERRLVNEEPYEVVDSKTLEEGPRKSRCREKGLFEGFCFLCIEPYVNVSIEQYQDLLRATGAIVVDSLRALAAEKNLMKIILIQADHHEFQIIEWYKRTRAIAIVDEWIVECISQYKLISFYPYLQELSRQDVLALGYPEYLVEEETGWESDSTCDL